MIEASRSECMVLSSYMHPAGLCPKGDWKGCCNPSLKGPWSHVRPSLNILQHRYQIPRHEDTIKLLPDIPVNFSPWTAGCGTSSDPTCRESALSVHQRTIAWFRESHHESEAHGRSTNLLSFNLAKSLQSLHAVEKC